MAAHSERLAEVPARATHFNGTSVVVIPHQALGDVTVYLRLAWLLTQAGAKVTFFSRMLYPARDYFPWLAVVEDEEPALSLAGQYDLVIACFERCFDSSIDVQGLPSNVAYVTAKKIPKDIGLDGRSAQLGDKVLPGAHRAFCQDSANGMTMVDWIDDYARRSLELEVIPEERRMGRPASNDGSTLIALFPTTPQAKKNYWLPGFKLLAHCLRRRGWTVEFVCMPHEAPEITSRVAGFTVRSFPDIRQLTDYLGSAACVISNDSGGGHLASMMGIPTFTITRRKHNFTWRPGFAGRNQVLAPWFRFRWMGRYIWRPFIPLWRILSSVGRPA